MYMNREMGPRGPMNGGPRRPMGSGMGGPGLNRGPVGPGMGHNIPFGPNGIWHRYPIHYGPMYHRRPYHPIVEMWHRPMMDGFGGMILLPIVMIVLALIVGMLTVVGEMFTSSGGGIIAGILIGLAIYYFVKKRNAGESANTDTDSYVEYEE